jgi:DNA-binding MarR family transcriptional regulator
MRRPASAKQAEEFVVALQSLLRELTVGSRDPVAGLPLAQLRVCRVLCDGPCSVSAISRALCISPSAVTQSADRLERAKLVRRVADHNDRRVRCLRLTARGESLLRRHDEERIRRAAAMLGQMTLKARHEAAAAMRQLAVAAAAARNSKKNDNHASRGLVGSKSRMLL